jgi:tetratricopeptide (TPR) repeat protein
LVLEGTIADATRAIELDPSQYSPYNLRAVARYLLKDYRGAIADYDGAIALKPPAEFLFLLYFSRGDARRLAGDLEGAIADCTRSIELHASGEAYDNRGMAYADRGDFERAAEDFKIAAEIFKRRGDSENYRAVTERLQKILRERPDIQNPIPEPSSWLFPDVIESARLISPRNVEGRIFNQFGLAYSLEELEALPVATMTPQELQKYADIVTHAYPDAVFRPIADSCKELPVEQMNTTAVANLAYVSLHAIVPATREKAANCLRELQGRWKDRDSAQ